MVLTLSHVPVVDAGPVGHPERVHQRSYYTPRYHPGRECKCCHVSCLDIHSYTFGRPPVHSLAQMVFYSIRTIPRGSQVVGLQHFKPCSGFTHTNLDLRILMWISCIPIKCLHTNEVPSSILMKCLAPYL